MATRDQLKKMLAHLDAAVPEMRRKFLGPGAFIGEFAGRAESITEAARDEDADWVFEQIDYLLQKHGYRHSTSDEEDD